MKILPREMGGPCRWWELHQIVIRTPIVLADNQNCTNRFRNSNWLLIPPTPGPVKYKYRLITKVNNELNVKNKLNELNT